MDSWSLLYDIVVLLGASLVVGAIFSRLGQSPLVGYLLVGMVLAGPGSIHAIESEHEVEAIAELGVALLLFSLGLEFSWGRLKGLGRAILGGGVLQILLTGALGALAAKLFGLSIAESVAVGAMVSLSSTACVLRVLMDRGEIDSTHGRNSVAVLLVQDMAVVPLAVLMTILTGGQSAADIAWDLGRILLMATGLVAALYLLLNVLAVRVLGRLTIERNRELSVLLAVVTGFGSTWAAHAAGISPALGAFVSGLFLGGSPFATQIRADVASLRVVLLTLFFGAAGMVADPVWMVHNAGLVIGVVALLVFGKMVAVWIALRIVGQTDAVALSTGWCLAQIGEFAFVLGAIGQQSGVLGEGTYQVMVSATILSLFLTPYLVPAAPRMGIWMTRRLLGRPVGGALETASGHAGPEVVIIGFGPAGRRVAAAMADQNRAVLVLDINPAAKRSAEEMGIRGEIGDALHVDVLEHARIEAAHTVVITIPARAAALTVLHNVRRLAPHAHVVVRSRYELHRRDFESAGAQVVIGDEDEVSKALSAHVLEKLREEAPSPEPVVQDSESDVEKG